MADDLTPELIDPTEIATDQLSRRQLMTLMGTAGAAGLAGCGGDGGDGGGGDGGDGGDGGGDGGDGGGGDGGNGGDGDGGGSDGGSTPQPTESAFTIGGQTEPTELQWNFYNLQRSAQGKEPLEGAVWSPIVKRWTVRDEWLADLANDWEYSPDEGTFTITLREGQEWFNGMEVTSQDLLTQHTLNKFALGENAGNWQYTEEIVKVDDYTLRYSLNGEVNPDIFINESFGANQLFTRRDIYEEYMQRYADASTDSERDGVTNDLISFAPDEPFGCGLWEPTTIESERMVAEVNETHWASDMVNWPNYEWIPTFWQARPEVQQQSLISGELDGSIRVVNATEDLLDQIPGEPIFPRVPTYNGFGINLNHTVEPLGDHRVRQALQHLIDFQKMAGQAVSMEHVDDTRYTGMSRYYVDNYLTDEVGNNLIDYGGRGVETARNLLKEAGLAENGDQWELPSGGQFTLDMLTVSGRVPWAQIAKNNFENIGIPVSINTEEASTFFGQSVPNGDFETALWTAGGWRQPFAFSDFNQTWNVDATPYAEGTQADLNPEIPWPMEGSGATREIDILSKINELGRATTTEDRNRLASELGWVYNVTVPQIKVTERHFVGMIQTDNWEVPAEDAEEMNVLTPVHYLPKLDAMKAKTE